MIITLPTDFITEITGSIGETMTNLWPIVILVAAVPFAFYVLRLVKGLLSVRAGRRA